MKINSGHPDYMMNYVWRSLDTAIIALTERYHLSNPETEEQRTLLETHPFPFYRTALDYTFNAEFTKLTHQVFDKEKPLNNIASIYFLNATTLGYASDFKDQYKLNKTAFKSIAKTEFFKRQWGLRHGRYSHSDGATSYNVPYGNYYELSDQDIQEGFAQLQVLIDICQSCSQKIKHYIRPFELPVIDTRTRDLFKNISLRR